MKRGIYLFITGMVIIFLVSIPKIFRVESMFFIPGFILGSILEVWGFLLIIRASIKKKKPK
ncbi:MAG: hypothetical protein IPP11_01070 [Chitinophagaceae bacterium]|nr:hypothetical protein [Chitinophagaceae bacterium]MBK9957181.1 hypothetical protein [Chitinophagaceae bacterium]HRB30016.1 hypothetical protein [Ferruginibacter sp.]